MLIREKNKCTKVSMPPEVTDRFSPIPTKTPAQFLTEIENPSQDPRTAKTTSKKKNKREGLTFPDFSTYYKATVIRTVCYWHKDKVTD